MNTKQSIDISLSENRCKQVINGKVCNRLLFKGEAKHIEILCPKCKQITTFKN